MGPATLQIEFGSDGRYNGTMNSMGATGAVSGTYKLNGNMLEMEPPTVTGPGGSASPSGGTMRVKLISQGPDAYVMDAGNQKFMMHRMGPAR